MILETKRLILRELQESDFKAVHAYGADPEVVVYMPFGPNTKDDTKEYLKRVLNQQKEQPRIVYTLALVRREDNKLIGSCSILVRSESNKEAEMGYILNRSYWNHGYITEAAKRLLRFGFEQLGLHRIYATCDPANVASFKVMEKIGMKREGLLRQHKLQKGKWRDSFLYSILEQEMTFTEQKN
ncbi:MAG: GNAT family N-acetyltransferase [Dehalococcoidales bacterium]|nr:MAG: GNAT family N-acetyltransferase [Dehalococcoidales bacterium]